jgi:hypothetical protein
LGQIGAASVDDARDAVASHPGAWDFAKKR